MSSYLYLLLSGNTHSGLLQGQRPDNLKPYEGESSLITSIDMEVSMLTPHTRTHTHIYVGIHFFFLLPCTLIPSPSQHRS